MNINKTYFTRKDKVSKSQFQIIRSYMDCKIHFNSDRTKMNSYFAKLTFNSYFYLHSLSFLILPLFLTYFLQLNSNSSGACMCMQTVK